MCSARGVVILAVLAGCDPSDGPPLVEVDVALDAGMLDDAIADDAIAHDDDVDDDDHDDFAVRARVQGPILRELLSTPRVRPFTEPTEPSTEPAEPMEPPAEPTEPMEPAEPPTLALPIDRCDGYWVPDQLFDGEVALTFDDGPNAATTPRVMATLRAHGAPATFFINGLLVRGPAERAIVDEIAGDPLFILANHTWSHPADPFLDELPVDRAQAQVDDVELIVRASGETERYFRFPFLRGACNTMRIVRDRALVPVGIHGDSADWCYAGGGGVCSWQDVPEPFRDGGMIDFILHQLERRRGGVLLLHDYYAYTADHLDALLTALSRAGYRFVALNDTAALPRLNGARFIGDACRDDGHCTFDANAFCHRAGFCTVPCVSECPARAGWASTFCAADGSSGVCLPRWEPLNRHCRDVANTEPRQLPRAASAELAWVCAPV
jgi:peptidoglycan/xylan/chitin deacetylase (PgdA/CDA1 family)